MIHRHTRNFEPCEGNCSCCTREECIFHYSNNVEEPELVYEE